ncbi:MAG: hypothetical protein ACRCSB_03150 [Bacteroidales bacterium]
MIAILHQAIQRFRLKDFFVGADGSLVHPTFILALLSSIGFIFLILSHFFSSIEVKVFSRYTINLPHIEELLNINPSEHHIISVDCSERGFFLSEPLQEQDMQSALPSPCTVDDIRELPIQAFEYPDDNYHIFSPLMLQLQNLPKTRNSFRIVHYGDSQLEADRMSLYIRQALQKDFGGGGIGSFALNPHIPINPTVRVSMSNDWQHSTAMIKYKKTAQILTGHLLSSVSVTPATNRPTWIKINRRNLRNYPPLRFSLVRMLIKTQGTPVSVEVNTPTRLLYEKSIVPKNSLQLVEVKIGANTENLTLSFSGGPFTLCGLSLDYPFGISLDNVPLRSSSGVDFKKAEPKTLKQSLELSKVKLLIFQFGTNIVPRIVNNYSFYEEQLYQQLVYFKKLQPDIHILVVGVADMARRVNGALASYPNIERIRDAQKRAAFRAGCAFWDSYKAMGGRSSMISWAYTKPALASKDFCHFSGDGATLMGELLHRALMQEFYWYLAEQEEAKNTEISSQQN